MQTIHKRRLRQLHRWIGLVLFVQLLAWTAGGAIMSILNLDAVRGADQANPAKAVPASMLAQIKPISALALDAQQSIRSIELGMLLEQPVYRVRYEKTSATWDAQTGQRLSPVPEALARRIAVADFAADAQVRAVTQIEKSPAGAEFRGRKLPLWQVQFDDSRNTTLYISAQRGEVVARRNDLWRIFDFVWMLHIMDYEQRDRINNPLLQITAVTSLLFCLTGVLMLLSSRWRKN